jgi:hypothetical protein
MPLAYCLSLVYLLIKITNKLNFLNLYLILLSIILEILHIFIPVRSFEFSDLFGNLLGVFNCFN